MSKGQRHRWWRVREVPTHKKGIILSLFCADFCFSSAGFCPEEGFLQLRISSIPFLNLICALHTARKRKCNLGLALSDHPSRSIFGILLLELQPHLLPAPTSARLRRSRVQLENLLALFDQLFCLLNLKKVIVAASLSNLSY